MRLHIYPIIYIHEMSNDLKTDYTLGIYETLFGTFLWTYNEEHDNLPTYTSSKAYYFQKMYFRSK